MFNIHIWHRGSCICFIKGTNFITISIAYLVIFHAVSLPKPFPCMACTCTIRYDVLGLYHIMQRTLQFYLLESFYIGIIICLCHEIRGTKRYQQ